MDNIARSLKSKSSKTRPATIYPEGFKKLITDTQPSLSLDSPEMDRRFSMPTVFHVYFSHAKNAQLYKSILISEHSTSPEVVKLALERYGMIFVNPREYAIYEVVGKWETMISSPEENSPQLPGSNKVRSPPVMEEFVIHYTREIGPKEKPYSVQTYSAMPCGYKRRFELRVREEGESVDGDKACVVPTTPLFGSTSHSARGRSESQGFPYPSVSVETGDTDQDVVRYRHSLAEVLDCSSPDSGLETKSSFTSDQSDSQPWSLYPILSAAAGPFLLNLQLRLIEKEFLVYRITCDNLVFIAGSPLRNNSSSCVVQQEMELNVPEGDGSIICSIIKEAESCYMLKPHGSATSNVCVNAVLVSTPVELFHGDLLRIGDTHLFMFQCPGGATPTTSWPYRWSLVKTVGHPTSSPVQAAPLERATVVSSAQLPTSSLAAIDSIVLEEVRKPLSPVKVVYVPHSLEPSTPTDAGAKLPTVQEVEGTSEDEQSYRVRSLSESQKATPHMPSPVKKRRAAASIAAAARHRAALPDDKKLMFSHDESEEDAILELLISKLDPQQTVFKLAPAYIITMCLEYSIKCNGTVAASRFACKAVECIQQTSWVSQQQTSIWKIIICFFLFRNSQG